jgi:transposase
MGKSSSGWPGGRKPCWRWIGENESWRSCTGRAWGARASGGCGSGTSGEGSKRSVTHPAVDGHRFFPSLQRVTIEQVACTVPRAYGWHLPRWDCRSLQQVVVEQAVVAAIHYTTVARILAEASLQPHRSRYWKTARLDEGFVRLAAKVLWWYEHVDWLHRRGEVVICMDEKPNIQALRRLALTQRLAPGRIERREFEYKRGGVVHLLVALNVYDGTMLGWCLEKNDHDHFLWGVRQVERRYPKARRIHLIVDNGGSHIAHDTQRYFARRPRLRALYTPVHASWLNQAELLLRAFTAKYLERFDAESRQHLIDHLNASWREYNHRFAHPFEWSWTRRDMYAWAAKKGYGICSQTYATVH